MSVDDESRDPTRVHLMKLAEHAGIAGPEASNLIDRVRSAIEQWPAIAADEGISAARITEIGSRLNVQDSKLKGHPIGQYWPHVSAVSSGLPHRRINSTRRCD